MNITPEIVAVIGTLGGTLVGAISTLLVTIIKNQSEERKHFKELIMKSASDNWKYIFVMCQHFSGHIFKQLFAASHNLLGTNSR